MDLQEEFECLKIAYRNTLNDLARTKAHLKEAEDTLRLLSRVLQDKASVIQDKAHTHDNPHVAYDHKAYVMHINRVDNPGNYGSGR